MVRRGRAVRKYGIQAEADAAKRLGLERRGRTTDPEDLGGAADPAVVQAKTGPGFASAAWIRELEALEISARNRPRILLAMEKPGRGRKGRRFVVMLEDEFVRLTGLDARRKALESAAELLERALPCVESEGPDRLADEIRGALEALEQAPAR